jgi:thiol-disulfide isomerase/thioredoxin
VDDDGEYLGAPNMRFIVAAIVTIGLCCFASCTETRNAPVASRPVNDTSSQSQPPSHDPPAPATDAHDEPAHAPSPSESSAERGHDHAKQHASHAKHHDTGNQFKMIAVGDKVPDFEVMIAGKRWKRSELQKNAAMTADGTLVLTFWCSFCHSCRHVEHSLDDLAKQYRGKAAVMAVDASAGETAEAVAEFAKQHNLTLPIALDVSGATADIFGARVTTTTVVIDKSGVLRYRGQFGDRQHAYAQEALQAVLADKDVPVQETRQRG